MYFDRGKIDQQVKGLAKRYGNPKVFLIHDIAFDTIQKNGVRTGMTELLVEFRVAVDELGYKPDRMAKR